MHSSIGLTNLPNLQNNDSAVSNLSVVTPIRPRSSGARFQSYLTVLEAVADFVAVIAAVMAGYCVYYLLELGRRVHYPHSVVLAVSATLAFLVVLMLDRAGAYSRGTSLLRVRETEQVLRVSMQAFGFAFGVSFFASFLFSRWLLAIALALVPLFLFVEKHLVYLLVQHLHEKGIGIERVLIFGSGSTGRRVYSVLRRSPKLGLEPVALVDNDPAKAGSAIFELAYERRRSAPVIRGHRERQAARANAAGGVPVSALPCASRRAVCRKRIRTSLRARP